MPLARWITALTLTGCLASLPAAAARPSFSCAKPAGAAEQAICGDALLAALDRESARLYGLAVGSTSGPARKELVAFQRGWIKGRNDCWKSSDPKTCIRDSYLSRIAELRTQFAAARGQDARGTSLGPAVVRCPAPTGELRATFVNVEPALAYLSGGQGGIVLNIARSGSGARYTATTPQGDALFWQKGPEAFVQWPGGPEQTCAVSSMR